MKKIVIIGAGGYGRDVIWTIERINSYQIKHGKELEWEIVGITEKNNNISELIGYPVIGDDQILLDYKQEIWCVCALGNPRMRNIVTSKLRYNTNLRFATIIDPTASIYDENSVGEGSVITAGAVISVDCNIGRHVFVGFNSSIGHNSILSDYVSIYPGARLSGNVYVGSGTEIGTGANILPKIIIGNQSIVGLGAVVIENVIDCQTVSGNPAQAIFKHKKWEDFKNEY